jgi:hypothetical protein
MAPSVVVTLSYESSQGARVVVGTREAQRQVGDAGLDVPVGVPDLAVVVDPDGAPYPLRVTPYSAVPVIEYPALPSTRSGSPSPFQMWACSATILKVTFSPPPPIRIGISRVGGGAATA